MICVTFHDKTFFVGHHLVTDKCTFQRLVISNLKVMPDGVQDAVSVGLAGLPGVVPALGLGVLLPVPRLGDLDSIHVKDSADRS